jgi:hypothetical protein
MKTADHVGEFGWRQGDIKQRNSGLQGQLNFYSEL